MRVLYSRYAGYLTGVCSRYIADDSAVKDILQDSFIKIFHKAEEFEYRGEGSLKAWMTRIVVNDSLKQLRKKKNLPLPPTLANEADVADEPWEYTKVPVNELHGMIRRLPDGYRTVFNLYVFENKSHREIAQLLGIKEDSSASQLHHARALLSRWIKEYIHTHNDE